MINSRLFGSDLNIGTKKKLELRQKLAEGPHNPGEAVASDYPDTEFDPQGKGHGNYNYTYNDITNFSFSEGIFDLSSRTPFIRMWTAVEVNAKMGESFEFIYDPRDFYVEGESITEEEKDVLERISEFRAEFKSRPGWEKGSPKRANNMTKYTAAEEKAGKTNMPGHVRASMNWNKCREMYGDKYSMPITDGAKVIVCKLKQNPLGYTSIAYPVDEMRIPEWFKELPFDGDAMEATILDQKIDNLIGVLDWDVQSTETSNTFNKLFEF